MRIIMNHNCIRFLSAVAALAMPMLAASANPADPAMNVPAVEYHTPFSDYRAYSDESLADWRSTNDAVARIGGHIGIMGGAAGHASHAEKKAPAEAAGQAAPAPGQPPARGAPQAPASGGHQH
jgi:hypothetical protein